MPVTAVYPGTFDPFTNGHSDLLRRAMRLFPRLILAVAANPQKTPLFTLEERLAIARQATADLPHLEIDSFHMLTVDYVHGKGAQVIVRGVRAVSDYEFEFAMALMNRKISEDIETVFLMPSQSYTYLSSRLVKEVALLGGNVGRSRPAAGGQVAEGAASQARLSGRRNA